MFPIMSAMSEFVVETAPARWEIKRPARFNPDEMIARALGEH